MRGAVKRAAGYVAMSAALLAPCFWQPRIQAGDLSSHVYNAWLAQLIERGQAPGLVLARQSNNVLFDLMLGGLMRAWGAAAAQRMAVGLAVLVFFWGAFALVWSWSRRRAAWALAPCLAMLAYGWVFRMGLFNFYISLGLSCGALALARQNKRWAWGAAAALWGLAYVAHPLPLAWAAGVLVYSRAAEALAPRYRPRLLAATVVGLAMAGLVLGKLFITRRGSDQFIALTGADQVWIYGKDYLAVAAAMLVLWALGFQRVIRARGKGRILLDVRLQLCVVGAASLVLLPGGVLLPGYRSGLDFLPERMSLAGAVLFCGLLASVRLPRALVGAMTALAAVFFALSYADERARNRVETRMEHVVAQLPPGQRVVSVLWDPGDRVRSLVHMIDRVCLGRCFSYANYEPCTWQFRVRAEGDSPLVASSCVDSWNMQTGRYRVKARDLPLYKVEACEAGGGLCAAPVEAGDTLGSSGLRIARIPNERHNHHD